VVDNQNSSRISPTSTYRLQINAEFDLNDAAELIEYLARLGISHLYSSPYFDSTPDSTHGYDVTDHGKVNPEFGGEAGRKRMCSELVRHEMGQLLDIVPNHMSTVIPANQFWYDLLKNGRESKHAYLFDIKWDSPDPELRGKVLLPVLTESLEEALHSGGIQLRREGDEIGLALGGRIAPISPQSMGYLRESAEHCADEGRSFSSSNGDSLIERINGDPGSLRELIDLQHYLPAHWREGNERVNYRRFFHITELVGIRMGDIRVFDYVHKLPLEWYNALELDGFRVDHPDGLGDPALYFNRLRERAPGTWIVAEKILTPGERLPDDWPIHGTTGYDFMNMVSGLFVDPLAEPELTRFYQEFTGNADSCREIVRKSKLEVLDTHFGAEVNRLTRLLSSSLDGSSMEDHWDREVLSDCIRELAACFPVYRTYLGGRDNRISDHARHYMDQALKTARKQGTVREDGLWKALRGILLEGQGRKQGIEFTIQFQQLTSAAMAKGFEDTALYRYNRLISRNEVGADPEKFSVSTEEFHEFCAGMQKNHPFSLLATSTHDTKRGEDVRMRINMISEKPREWIKTVRRLSEIGDTYRLNGCPDRNTEYFLYQTLVGTWPIKPDRLIKYMRKSVREAKTETCWTDPDNKFEEGMENFITGILEDEEFIASLEEFMRPVRDAIGIVSLSRTLIKYTAPGVPDLYQGCELWDMNLVDPDNRRPVDYEIRRKYLEEIEDLEPAEILSRMEEGLPKLFLIHRLLRLRRDSPELLDPQNIYTPVSARGDQAGHVLAFLRGEDTLTVAPRLILRLGEWDADTRINIPPGNWIDLFTGRETSGDTPIRALLEEFPVSLLIRR